MYWNQEIEIDIGGGRLISLTLEEIHELLTENLTKDKLEEFAGELIKWVELSPAPPSLLD
jgi:hypothetical protein